MNVFPLFSTPVTLSMNNIDMMFYEIETMKRESFHEHGEPLDGFSTNNRNVLLKYPNLLNVVHKHIKKSLYDELKIVNDVKYKILSSWLNRHPPKHSARKHTHPNSMFTGVLYIDCPENSGDIVFSMPFSTPTWTTGTIQPQVKEYNILNSRDWILSTQTGMCILFPSHLEHHVTPNESNQDRYALGFNVMLEGDIANNKEVGEFLSIKTL